MIEFRADCGHTIELPDHEAGKIVKCAYCGREVQAPQREEQDPDFLFEEVDLNELAKGEGLSGTASMTIQGQQKKAKAAPAAEEVIQPDNSALRITMLSAFGVICLVILFVVFRSVLNFAKDDGPPVQAAYDGAPESTGRAALPTPSTAAPQRPPPRPQSVDPEGTVASAKQGRIGYLFPPGTQGLFVETFHPNAQIYIRGKGSAQASPLASDDAEFHSSGTQQIALSPAAYQVAVAYDLDDADVRRLPDFDDLLADLDFDGDARAAEDYFIRDRGLGWQLIHTDSGLRLARYYDVAVRSGEWAQVTSLFVPGQDIIEALAYLPEVSLYDFDVEQARGELAGLRVPAGHRQDLLDLLARAGQLVYPLPSDQPRVFEIDVRDGSLRSYDWTTPERQPPAHEAQITQQPALPAAPPPGRRTGRSPFDRGRVRSPARPPQTETLADVIARFKERLQADGEVPAADWRRYLVGGDRHHILARADVRTRAAFVELIDGPAARELLEDIGRTLSGEPEIDVRLAWLEALGRSATPQALQILDRRRRTISEERSLNPDEANRELQALGDVRKKLQSSGRGKRRNPWDR